MGPKFDLGWAGAVDFSLPNMMFGTIHIDIYMNT